MQDIASDFIYKRYRQFPLTSTMSRCPVTTQILYVEGPPRRSELVTSRRKCLIVGGQTRDSETQIFFKVLEYKTEAVEKFSIGAWISAPVDVKFVPIHPSRIATMTDKLQAQFTQGVSNVTARIKRAVGQNLGDGQ